MLISRYYPILDADGAASGVATQTGDAGTQEPNTTTNDAESGQEGADERKTGTDVKSEAQNLADGIVRKRLKGLSREEIDLFKEHKDELVQYLDAKKTAEQRIADAQRKAAEALSAAEKREARAEAMMQAVKAGIMTEHIEDAVILAMARVSDDVTIDEAIQAVAKGNPSWRTGVDLPGTGGNPAGNEGQKKEPPILI